MNTNILKLFTLFSVLFGAVNATAITWPFKREPLIPVPISSEPNCSFNLTDVDQALVDQMVEASLIGPIDVKEIASVTPVQVELDSRYASWPLARHRAVWWTAEGQGQMPAKLVKMWSGRIMVILQPDLAERAEFLAVPGTTATILDNGRILYALDKQGIWQRAGKGDEIMGVVQDGARVLAKEDVSPKGKSTWTFYPRHIPGLVVSIGLNDTVELEDGRRLVMADRGVRVAPARGAIRVLSAQVEPPLSTFMSWAQQWLENYTWDQGFPKLDELAKAVVTLASIENDAREFVAFVGPKGPRDRWVRVFEYPRAKHVDAYTKNSARAFLQGGIPLIQKDGRWFLRDDDPGVVVEPVKPKPGPTPTAAASLERAFEMAD